jgi:hypothetical protein
LVLDLLRHEAREMRDTELVDLLGQDPWDVRVACEALVAERRVKRVDLGGELAFRLATS